MVFFILVKVEPEDVNMEDVKPKLSPKFSKSPKRSLNNKEEQPQITCAQLFCSNFQVSHNIETNFTFCLSGHGQKLKSPVYQCKNPHTASCTCNFAKNIIDSF